MDQHHLLSPDMPTDPCFVVECLNDHHDLDHPLQRFNDAFPSMTSTMFNDDMVDRLFQPPPNASLNQFDHVDNLFPPPENFSTDIHQFEHQIWPLPSPAMEYPSYPPTTPLFTFPPTPPVDLLPPFHHYDSLPGGDTSSATHFTIAPFLNSANTTITHQHRHLDYNIDVEMNGSDGSPVLKSDENYPSYHHNTQVMTYFDEELVDPSDNISRDNYNNEFEVAGDREPYGHLATSTRALPSSTCYSRRKVGEELGFDEIQKCFHLPIAVAARQLNVGLTVLKRRCRQLNIQRWPHRKIKSLKSLIRNVKELGLGIEVEMLEENARMIQEIPGLDLPDKTKKLRQHCFKVNYKRKRATGSSTY